MGRLETEKCKRAENETQKEDVEIRTRGREKGEIGRINETR